MPFPVELLFGRWKNTADQLSKQLMAQAAGKKIENLNSADKKTIAEYYTTDEVVQFKKPKMRKVKKVRKRGELGFDADEDDGQDRGSRNSERVTKRQRDDQKDKERRNDSYQMALRTETELTNMTTKGQVDSIRTST